LNVQKGESQVSNNPEVVRPTEYTEETVTKEYRAPAREIYF